MDGTHPRDILQVMVIKSYQEPTEPLSGVLDVAISNVDLHMKCLPSTLIGDLRYLGKTR